ncbi:MAG: IS1595 family transposase [Acidobacteria bacterium]|nr:IS1595 family transposase [Acidobacteriota bacterium]
MSRKQSGPGHCYRDGISLPELFQMFPDDATAEAWFVNLRWPDGEIACHYCGSTNVQTGCKHKTMPFRCREKDCAMRFSVRTGTVMQSSKLGFQVWAIASYLMSTSLKGVSSMKLHRDLDITQKSAWHLAHRLREGHMARMPGQFRGPVEADETFVGGKAKNMHRDKRAKLTGRGGVDKTVVAGVKDRATNRVVVSVVKKVDQPTMIGFVSEHTRDGAQVYTDEASAYDKLPNRQSVKHGVGQ